MIHGYDTDNADDNDDEAKDDLESRPICAGGFREARWSRSRGSFIAIMILHPKMSGKRFQ